MGREDDDPECHGMAQISGQSTLPDLLSYSAPRRIINMNDCK